MNKICAGVALFNNVFTYNLGLKKGNGGALTMICDILDNPNNVDYYSTSAYISLFAIFNLITDVLYTVNDLVNPA
jgi:hypothetical protein